MLGIVGWLRSRLWWTSCRLCVAITSVTSFAVADAVSFALQIHQGNSCGKRMADYRTSRLPSRVSKPAFSVARAPKTWTGKLKTLCNTKLPLPVHSRAPCPLSGKLMDLTCATKKGRWKNIDFSLYSRLDPTRKCPGHTFDRGYGSGCLVLSMKRLGHF